MAYIDERNSQQKFATKANRIDDQVNIDPRKAQAGQTFIPGSASGSTMDFAGTGASVPPPSIADQYRDLASEWYGGFGINEKGMLSDAYRYNPELIDQSQLQMAEAFDFAPLRGEAMGNIYDAASSGLQTAYTQQAAAGGLTAADRMALASSFNRQRMGGVADVGSKFGIAEAENLYDVGRANQDMLNQVYLQNLEAENQAEALNMERLIAQREKQAQAAMDMYEKSLRAEAGVEISEGKTPTRNPYEI
jgi:hypothetical protein